MRFNSMVAVIEWLRWRILAGQSNLDLPRLAASVIVVGFVLWVGTHRLRKMERSFADFI